MRAAAVQAPVGRFRLRHDPPATLCGYAPRQRLDLSVNILTNHAINNGKITVFGGSQLRPNLHVQDMCDLYKLLIDIDSTRIAGKIFNCGFQNMSIMDIALVVKRIVEAEFPEKGGYRVVTTPTDDIRSYHINSDKIQHELGFKPHFFIEDAVRDLCRAFKRGDLPNSLTDDDRYFNVRTLKALRAAMNDRRSRSSPGARASSAVTWSICCWSAASKSA